MYDKVRPALYVTLKKDLYGWLISSFLFYGHLLSEMRGRGFKLNPYKPCAVNKIVGGNKIILFWNVDDLKVSHVNPKEVTNFMEWLDGIYR